MKKEVGIFCNFIKLIRLFMYFTILMIFTKQNIYIWHHINFFFERPGTLPKFFFYESQ